MADTPNHSYNKPSKGDTDWHTPLNENFDLLETDVAVWSTESDILNNHTPHNGAHAVATDTKAVYQGDGTQWNSIGSIAVSGGSGGSVTIQDNGTDIVTGASGINFVTDLEAVVNSNDSDVADVNFTGSGSGGAPYYSKVSSWSNLQSEIDNAASSGGGTVLLEAGTYTVSSSSDSVEMKSNVTLAGEGPDLTQINTTITSQQVIGSGSSPISNAEVRDLSIDGSDTGESGIHIGYSLSDPDRNSECAIRNVKVTNCVGGGVGFQRTNDSVIEGCYVEGCGKVAINSAVNCNRNILSQNLVRGSYPSASFSHGISIEQSFNCTVANNVAHGGSNPALAINMNTHVGGTISNNVIRTCDPGIECVRTAKYNTVVGNSIDDAQGDAIDIRQLDSDIPEYNIFANNIINAPGGNGIYEQNSGHNFFTGNIIRNPTANGVDAYNPEFPSSFIGNEIIGVGSTYYGITQDQSTQDLHHKIADNVIETTDTPAIHSHGHNVDISNNFCVNGDITGGEVGPKYIHNNILQGGDINLNGGSGSYIVFNILDGGSVSDTATGTTVSNNV